MPETSCMKGTSVHIKNLCIKQLCSHKFGDFATAFQVKKCFGTFEKQVPGQDHCVVFLGKTLYSHSPSLCPEESRNTSYP